MRIAYSDSPQILDACCGGRHWWWDKAHPLALYMDARVAEKGCVDVRPNFEVCPDVVGDFRAMPFEDGAFQLVLFDPPHNVRDDPNNGYVGLKYGALPAETEQEDLRRGFAECWRVLAPGGTLVFKWAGALERVKPHFPDTPIVGTRSPRGGQTRWFVFYKPLLSAEKRDATITFIPTEHKTNGAAPAMSPERRDALSGKDSPSGTDSRSQSGRTASPDSTPTIAELQEAIRLLDNALVQWLNDIPSPANMRPHREALWLVQDELSRLRGETRLIGV